MAFQNSSDLIFAELSETETQAIARAWSSATEKLRPFEDINLESYCLATILKPSRKLMTKAVEVDLGSVELVNLRVISIVLFGGNRLNKFPHGHTEASMWLYGIGSMHTVFE